MLKLSLWEPFEHDRDAYTAHKTDFVKQYTLIAKEEFKGKYEITDHIKNAKGKTLFSFEVVPPKKGITLRNYTEI